MGTLGGREIGFVSKERGEERGWGEEEEGEEERGMEE